MTKALGFFDQAPDSGQQLAADGGLSFDRFRCYIYRMRRVEEWDFPPRRRRYYRTIDAYQPSGWNSPGVKKAANIYWRTTITIIKLLLAVPLSIMAIGAFWLLWTIITIQF
jgi:hypothetical protein